MMKRLFTFLMLTLILAGCQQAIAPAPEAEVSGPTVTPSNVPQSVGPSGPPSTIGPNEPPPVQAVTQKENIRLTLPPQE